MQFVDPKSLFILKGSWEYCSKVYLSSMGPGNITSPYMAYTLMPNNTVKTNLQNIQVLLSLYSISTPKQNTY